MLGFIKRNPTLPFKDLFHILSSRDNEAEESASNVSYTGYSRFALYNILRLLNLPSGSEILMPAYICDVLLLSFAQLGLKPVYYGITDKFQIDYGTVTVSSKTKVIITVNYFGMSQDFDAIRSFIDQYPLVWVNDNSHGFASCHGEKSLELYGDFSVTSFRKVLPVLNGSRVCVNNNKYASLNNELLQFNHPPVVENKKLRFFTSTLLGNLHYRPWRHPDYSDIMAFSEPDIMGFQCDHLSQKILRMTEENTIQESRYRLYREVGDLLSNNRYDFIETIPGLLQPGNSPMVFPVLVSNGRAWESTLRISRKLGIDIHTWPSMPREVIAQDLFESATFWRKLLYLPIHQGLDASVYRSRLTEVLDLVRDECSTDLRGERW